MSFNSLDRLMKILEQQPGWEEYRQFKILSESWQSFVGSKIAQHTRILHITRDLLWVATSSSVWAQTLSMQRYSLLKKINAQFSWQLKDIRFSTAQWHRSPENTPSKDRSTNASEQHPSHLDLDRIDRDQLPLAETPQQALARWMEVLKMRSQHLPLCPQCNCHTPEGELLRWGLCRLCISKQWSNKCSEDFESNL